jgi:hypothetical protein
VVHSTASASSVTLHVASMLISSIRFSARSGSAGSQPSGSNFIRASGSGSSSAPRSAAAVRARLLTIVARAASTSASVRNALGIELISTLGNNLSRTAPRAQSPERGELRFASR